MPSGVYNFARTGDTSSALTVNFSVGGSAMFNTDYTVSGAATFSATAGSIVIPAGQSGAGLTVTTVTDTAFESNETVILTLVDSFPIYSPGTAGGVTFTIANDDVSTYSNVFTWSSNGDINDVTYWLQSGNRSSQYTLSASTPVTRSDIAIPFAMNGVSGFYAANIANAFWRITFTTGFAPDRYWIRNRIEYNDNLLKNWKLQGSVDGSTNWVDLDSQTNIITTIGSYYGGVVNSGGTVFKAIRVLSTGVDSGGAQSLIFEGIGLYGGLV